MPTPDRLADPAYAFEVGRDFAEAFGVTADPFTNPAAYEAEMYKANPRSAQKLVRYELEASETQWPEEAKAIVDRTAGDLGMLESEYPFSPSEEAEIALVAGGARNAMPDRAGFGARAIRAGARIGKMLVAGSEQRVLKEAELEVVRSWAPEAKTEADLALPTARRMLDEYPDVFTGKDAVPIEPFRLRTRHPDHRAAVQEAGLRPEGLAGEAGRLLIVTQALYVPFKTHKTLAVTERLANVRSAEVRGVGSRPDIVAKRTTDTYASDIAQTLMSAAQHQQARRR